MNYHNRSFRAVSNTDNGEVSGDTVFRYQQEGSTITATYAGGRVAQGYLLGAMLRATSSSPTTTSTPMACWWSACVSRRRRWCRTESSAARKLAVDHWRPEVGIEEI